MKRVSSSPGVLAGAASAGVSIAIVLALAAAVSVAVILKGNRDPGGAETAAAGAGVEAAPGSPAADAGTEPADASASPASAAEPAAASTTAASWAAPPDAAPAAAVAPAPARRIPRLVDLGAKKCIPCKMMAPILDALREDFAGKLEVVFIDVWESPQEARKYGIRLIPTQIFYDASGQERFRHEGFYSREDILRKWKELGVDLGESQAAAAAN